MNNKKSLDEFELDWSKENHTYEWGKDDNQDMADKIAKAVESMLSTSSVPDYARIYLSKKDVETNRSFKLSKRQKLLLYKHGELIIEKYGRTTHIILSE